MKHSLSKEFKEILRSQLYQILTPEDLIYEEFLKKDRNKRTLNNGNSIIEDEEIRKQLCEAYRVMGPIFDEAKKKVCLILNHELIDDQCGKPEHRFCIVCNKSIDDIEKDKEDYDY